MSRPSPRLTLLASSLGFALITLDILIVNLALVEVRLDLGATDAALQWVVDGYTLPFAALLILGGNLTDRFGASRTFGVASALFAAFSLACAAAPTVEFLVAARVGQGVAAAGMLPASMALLRHAFPEPAERARALGVWAVGAAVASGAGPVIGGALTTVDWRLVFVINLPICALILVLMKFVAPVAPHHGTFDWRGQIVLIVSLTALIWGLIEGTALGWSEPAVIVALALAGVGFVALGWLESRVPHPMVPLELLRSGVMRIASFVGLAFSLSWFGAVFAISIFLQQSLGLNALQAGLVFLPASILSIGGNVISGAITNRFSERVPIVLGMGMVGIGLAGLAATAHFASPLLIGAWLLLVAPGGSIAMPPTTGVVLHAAPLSAAGAASGVFNTLRQIGGAVSIAVLGGVAVGATDAVRGLQLSMGIAAIVAISATIAAMWLSTSRLRRADE